MGSINRARLAGGVVIATTMCLLAPMASARVSSLPAEEAALVEVATQAAEVAVGSEGEAVRFSSDGVVPGSTHVSLAEALEVGDVSIELPGGEPEFSVQDGDAVVVDAQEDMSLVVDPLPGGARISAVLATPEADHDVSYEFSGNVVTQLDGSAILEDRDGALLGLIAAPWAVDADGKHVETYYTADGAVLTQHIIPGEETVYPVVADPTYRTFWWGRTWYHNRSETQTIATGGGVCAATLANFGTPGRIAGTICAVGGLVAADALVRGKCFRYNSPWSVAGGHPWSGTC